MTEDPRQADYILMINWGQTTPEADAEEVKYDGFGEDEDVSIVIDEVPEAKKRKNAQLLGASKLYNMSHISLKKRLLEEAIVHDRYFINIYAVSIDEIKNRDTSAKGPKVKATWECQLVSRPIMTTPFRHLSRWRALAVATLARTS
ncbi:MAG: hypothetical protein ABF329_01695, partial [Lentimonas sp.]